MSEISIFDRWSNLVFNKEHPRLNDQDQGWSPNDSAQDEQGVYIYKVEYQISGEVLIKFGSLTLLR